MPACRERPAGASVVATGRRRTGPPPARSRCGSGWTRSCPSCGASSRPIPRGARPQTMLTADDAQGEPPAVDAGDPALLLQILEDITEPEKPRAGNDWSAHCPLAACGRPPLAAEAAQAVGGTGARAHRTVDCREAPVPAAFAVGGAPPGHGRATGVACAVGRQGQGEGRPLEQGAAARVVS